MPDMTMCTGGECPRKAHCYRFTATSAGRRQSYFMVPPLLKDHSCKHYWPEKVEEDDAA